MALSYQPKKHELVSLLKGQDDQELREYLFDRARNISQSYYGNKVFTRGLIEFSNICKNNCYYCGIRAGNKNVDRYSLSLDEIYQACENGYELGYRTFVLQSGEDEVSYKEEDFLDLIFKIRRGFPDCAITLSLGEKPYDFLREAYRMGADRYLLRHETANKAHYEKLHPLSMSYENRMKTLYSLKEIGYQVGLGFMVNSPYQTYECLSEDFIFIKKFKPDMIGIGPFIATKNTPFAEEESGGLDQTLFCIGILRLMNQTANIPATTALGTIHPLGREKGILAGANVVMPNLSPKNVRKKYLIYDNKICTGEEAAECRFCLNMRMDQIGYELVVDRGDPKEEKIEVRCDEPKC